VLLGSCQAEPPAPGPGTGIDPVQGPYASYAVCMTPGTTQNPCPGSACARNAVGSPDGTAVDMGVCRDLQLSFTTGLIVPLRDQPDLAIHTTALGGVTRVQASSDGFTFTDIAFVGQHPYPAVPERCRAEQQGGKLVIYIDRCGYQADINTIRLERELSSSVGLQVDAIEALTFRPNGQPKP
jgi:hypothetical protein